jgi:hypothetical protein
MRPRLPRHLLAARPWRSGPGRLLHRALDRQADAALVRDRDSGRPPTPPEVEDWRMTVGHRVLLTTLSVRTSAKGRRYLSGWLGKAGLVAFEGEPDKFGNPTWNVFLSEPEPRPDQPRSESRKETTR